MVVVVVRVVDRGFSRLKFAITWFAFEAVYHPSLRQLVGYIIYRINLLVRINSMHLQPTYDDLYSLRYPVLNFTTTWSVSQVANKRDQILSDDSRTVLEGGRGFCLWLGL